jgi:hypothetical protein
MAETLLQNQNFKHWLSIFCVLGKGLLDDLEMDYEEEFVGDEHELERSYGMTKYGKIQSAASGELAALCHSVGNKNQFFSVKGLFF